MVDEVEQLAIDRLKQLFGAEHANVQPHSGAQANFAAFMALIPPGDTLMGMSLPHGGHLSHGAAVNHSGVIWQAVHYGVDPATGRIDYDEVREQAQPRAARGSSSPAAAPTPGSSTSRRSAPSPTRSAPSSWWTWRTSPGWWRAASTRRRCRTPTSSPAPPTRRCAARAPGSSSASPSTPRRSTSRSSRALRAARCEHVIAAKAVAFGEALTDDFKVYAQQVVENAKALADGAGRARLRHRVGRHRHPPDAGGPPAQEPHRQGGREVLGKAGITVNKNTIPDDPQSPFVTSGIRHRHARPLTTRGMGTAEMERIARAHRSRAHPAGRRHPRRASRGEVRELTSAFPLYQPARARRRAPAHGVSPARRLRMIA